MHAMEMLLRKPIRECVRMRTIPNLFTVDFIMFKLIELTALIDVI